MKKRVLVLGMTVWCCSVFAGCSAAGIPQNAGAQQNEGADVEMSAQDNLQGTEEGQETAADSTKTDADSINASEDSMDTSAGSAAQSTGQNGLPPAENQIKDQTFEVELNSLGKVTFASYTTRTEQEPNGDAVFALLRGDEVLQILEGIEKNNVRTDRRLESVAAVSFPDYNADGISDIITICNYEPLDGDEEKASEVRIYTGGADGHFTLERELSSEADSALAEKTIKSVLGFLGAPGSRTDAGDAGETAGWQQAYIDCISRQSTDEVEGYHLIYLDADEVPELVVIGSYEAAGCRIVSFCDGKIYQNQLNRLYFSYIEGGNLLCNSEGNMDCYYDLVYTLDKQGLKLVAEGYYGAEDNSNVQYDALGEPIYYYEWNGARMTKEEYAKALNSVYDTSRAKDGYEYGKIYSAEQMIELLQGM